MASGDNLENAEQEATAGAVSRRFLVRRTVALAISAPLLLTVLQACGGDEEEEPADTVTEDEPAEEDATETTSGDSPSTPPPSASPVASPAGGATPVASPAASPAAVASPVASPVTIETTGDAATPAT